MRLGKSVDAAIAIHTAVANAHHDKTVNFPGHLTVVDFIVNPATGTFYVSPSNINDGSTGTIARANAVNQYAEVDFVRIYAIRSFRQYGTTVNVLNGRWKIQYWDGTAWQDWETGIPTRANNWSAWVFPVAGVVLTSKIRVVCTTVDSGASGSEAAEFEVKG